MLRRLVAMCLRAAGFESTPLGGGWLVQRAGRKPRLRCKHVDGRSWLVQRGNLRSVHRIGGSGSGAQLILNNDRARHEMARVQIGLARWLAEEQVAWLHRRLDVNCVLDVGANVGQYASALRRGGYRGRIVSFEPVSALADQLRMKAAADPDWLVYDCALGDTETTTDINVAVGAQHEPALMSSLLPSSEFGKQWSRKLRDMDRERIRVSRLDSLFDEAVLGIENPRVFLKLDTQGYDVRAFSGAGRYVDRLVGLQSEVSCVPIYEGMPPMVEQIAVYQDAGFSPAGMFQVSRHVKTLRVIEFDLIMVRDALTETVG